MQPALRRHSRWVKNVNASKHWRDEEFPMLSRSLRFRRRDDELDSNDLSRSDLAEREKRRLKWKRKQRRGGCSDWSGRGSRRSRQVAKWLSRVRCCCYCCCCCRFSCYYSDALLAMLAMQTQALISFVCLCLFFGLSLLITFFFLRALDGAAATEYVGFVPVSTTHSFNGSTCRRPPHLLQHNTHESY